MITLIALLLISQTHYDINTQFGGGGGSTFVGDLNGNDLTDTIDNVVDMAKVANFVAGSAAAPACYGADDVNTGFYWDGSDLLGVTAAGTTVATFSASGLCFPGYAGTAPYCLNGKGIMGGTSTASEFQEPLMIQGTNAYIDAVNSAQFVGEAVDDGGNVWLAGGKGIATYTISAFATCETDNAQIIIGYYPNTGTDGELVNTTFAEDAGGDTGWEAGASNAAAATSLCNTVKAKLPTVVNCTTDSSVVRFQAIGETSYPIYVAEGAVTACGAEGRASMGKVVIGSPLALRAMDQTGGTPWDGYTNGPGGGGVFNRLSTSHLADHVMFSNYFGSIYLTNVDSATSYHSIVASSHINHGATTLKEYPTGYIGYSDGTSAPGSNVQFGCVSASATDTYCQAGGSTPTTASMPNGTFRIGDPEPAVDPSITGDNSSLLVCNAAHEGVIWADSAALNGFGVNVCVQESNGAADVYRWRSAVDVYMHAYVTNASAETIPVTGVGTWDIISDGSTWNLGMTNGFSEDGTSDKFIPLSQTGLRGRYVITYSVSFTGTVAASKDYQITVTTDDNTTRENCYTERNVTTTTGIGNVGGTCVVDLDAATNKVFLVVQGMTDGSDIEVHEGNLTLRRL